jgi:hypothetical protein
LRRVGWFGLRQFHRFRIGSELLEPFKRLTMSAEAALGTRSWKVGHRTIVLTLQRPKRGAVVHAVAEWTPTAPTGLSSDEWIQYRTGRDKALAELSAELGINAAVLEV